MKLIFLLILMTIPSNAQLVPFGFFRNRDPYLSSVVFLTHADSANASTNIIDYKAKTITANGNAQASTAQFRYGTASASFDGTNSYLTVPDHADFDFGSGDFTVEFWIYPTAAQNGVINSKRAALGNFSPYLLVRVAGGGVYYYLTSLGASSFDIASASACGNAPINTWKHIALTRSGSTFRCFVGGTVSATTATSALALFQNAATMNFGGDLNGNYFTGYIDDIRITKGVARYTATFVPPIEHPTR